MRLTHRKTIARWTISTASVFGSSTSGTIGPFCHLPVLDQLLNFAETDLELALHYPLPAGVNGVAQDEEIHVANLLLIQKVSVWLLDSNSLHPTRRFVSNTGRRRASRTAAEPAYPPGR